jgi:hypothetical protein
MSARAMAALVAALVAAAAVFWQLSGSPDARAIRQRFDELAADVNGTGGGGLDAVTRAARLAGHVTPDVVVELGQGSPPIEGRETLIGMAGRLQPRTAAFDLEFQDVTIEEVAGGRAEVAFTAVIRRRTSASDESMDAREFRAQMVRGDDAEWRIARVVAIDTLR